MCNNERKPHVHAELIKAWADGAEIQYWSDFYKGWFTSKTPWWETGTKYRIKPEQTDLEKYGVEKGDVWVLDACIGLHFIHSKNEKVAVACALSKSSRADVKHSQLEKLLFRRGVVDKL